MGIAQDRGHAGEALAAAYLELVGCRTLVRNARLSGVEVDLVVQDGETQVLVEVRLRSRPDYGRAAETIDARKRDRLVRAARGVAQRNGGDVRVDVVAVDLEPGGARLRHYRNAVTG